MPGRCMSKSTIKNWPAEVILTSLYMLCPHTSKVFPWLSPIHVTSQAQGPNASAQFLHRCLRPSAKQYHICPMHAFSMAQLTKPQTPLAQSHVQSCRMPAHTCAALSPARLARICAFRAGPCAQAGVSRQSSAGCALGRLPLAGALWLLSEAAARADQSADFSQGGFAKESYYVTLGLFLLSLPGSNRTC